MLGDYCVKRHVKALQVKIVYSATVTLMGRTASNRDLGGKDSSSPEGVVKRALENWLRVHGQQ